MRVGEGGAWAGVVVWCGVECRVVLWCKGRRGVEWCTGGCGVGGAMVKGSRGECCVVV